MKKIRRLKSCRLLHGDCLEILPQLPATCIDLVFADPPFNIGHAYDEYDDSRTPEEYEGWSRRWMRQVLRVLKGDGTFWLAIGDEYVAELKMLATRELDLSLRGWIIWYYTFGVHCNNKFTRSHTHLLYFVKNPKGSTFNDDAIRVPSARQLVYGDKRANPKGRVPDDTWILRPHDVPEGFAGNADTWYFPRVCGTFKERKGFHGCQMPERILGRVIRACSNEGDLVLDPFVGSGTTAAVAKKLNRRYVGIELSKDYVAKSRARLSKIKRGDPLEGSEDPLTSVPSTAKGKRVRRRGSTKRPR